MSTVSIIDYDFQRRVLKEGGAKTFWIEINLVFGPMNILLSLADGEKGSDKKEEEIINFFSSLGKKDALYTAEVKGKMVIAKYVHATSTISLSIEEIILELPYQPSAKTIDKILVNLRRKEGEE